MSAFDYKRFKVETVNDVAKDLARESKYHRMTGSSSMSLFTATKYALRFQGAHLRAVDELVDMVQRLKDQYCGACHYRPCEEDLAYGEQPVPCSTVLEAVQLIKKYTPKPPPADDGNPF